MIPCRDLSKLQCTWRHRAFPAQAGYRPRYRQGLAAPGRDGPPGILSSAKLGRDHRAQRFAVQQITAQAGGLAAIQDQGPGATFVQGMQTGLHLGDHAAVDDTGLDELGDAGAVQGGDQLLVRIQDAGNVGDQHEVVGMQGPGHGTGRRVRIDVQGLAFRTGGHWRHHGQEAAVQQTGKHGGIDLFHIAHQAQHRVLHPRPQQARITPGKARGTGAVLQMLSHGLMTALFFALIGMIYGRTHTRDVRELSGLMKVMPFLAVGYVIAGLANLGLPGLSGFVAEMTIFNGAFMDNDTFHRVVTIIACTSIVITAVYILRVVGKILYGTCTNEAHLRLSDATWDERLSVVCLVVAIAGMGLAPLWVSDMIRGSVSEIITHLMN